MNRITQKFSELRKAKKKAFIAFLTAGDPSLQKTIELVLAFEKVGVDIVEIGVPFSDPLADGPTIQAASQRSLSKGTTLEKILQAVSQIRKRSQIPIALMTYYNPVFHYGEEKFVIKAKASGIDGVIIPDLPPEEAGNLIKAARKKDFATVFFLSPTTTKERIATIAKASSGFIYYVSLTGVTGSRQSVGLNIAGHIKNAKKLTRKPICVGFGISNAAQVRQVGKISDGVIVGSAIVDRIYKNKDNKNLISNVAHFVSDLVKSL